MTESTCVIVAEATLSLNDYFELDSIFKNSMLKNKFCLFVDSTNEKKELRIIIKSKKKSSKKSLELLKSSVASGVLKQYRDYIALI